MHRWQKTKNSQMPYIVILDTIHDILKILATMGANKNKPAAADGPVTPDGREAKNQSILRCLHKMFNLNPEKTQEYAF